MRADLVACGGGAFLEGSRGSRGGGTRERARQQEDRECTRRGGHRIDVFTPGCGRRSLKMSACSTAPFQMRLTDYLKQFGDFSSGGLFFLPVCLCRMGTCPAESKKNLERTQRSRIPKVAVRRVQTAVAPVQKFPTNSPKVSLDISAIIVSASPPPASLGCSQPSRTSPPSRLTSANTSSVEKMFLLYL